MENFVTRSGRKKEAQISKQTGRRKLITEEDIRLRAFEIYLENGGKSNELDNWLKAEKELKSQ